MPIGQIQPVDGSTTCNAATATGSNPVATVTIPPGAPIVVVAKLTPLTEALKPGGETADGGPGLPRIVMLPPTPLPSQGPPDKF
jgi:hypothetical protein